MLGYFCLIKMSDTNQQILISVPNANTTLVLGILSIISCICYGLPGLIFALIALWISKYGESKYREQPGIYTLSSYNNLIAGKTCAYIGLFFLELVFVDYTHLFVDVRSGYFYGTANGGYIATIAGDARMS